MFDILSYPSCSQFEQFTTDRYGHCIAMVCGCCGDLGVCREMPCLDRGEDQEGVCL